MASTDALCNAWVVPFSNLRCLHMHVSFCQILSVKKDSHFAHSYKQNSFTHIYLLKYRHLKMLLEQHPLLLASFGMTVDMVKQEIEKATALEKLKVSITHSPTHSLTHFASLDLGSKQ